MIKLLNKTQIQCYFDTLSQYIIPESELKWKSNLDLVIAVVLSAQCTDKAVNKVTNIMFQTLRTPQDYIDAGEKKITHHIKSIGLYRNKTKSIIGLCHMLICDFNCEIPDNLNDLQKLPGVGIKTANVVLNVVFKQPTLAVDTHIFRLANRCGFVKTKTPEKTGEPLKKKIPKKYLLDAHHFLILHGRYVCKARKPECWNCKVKQFCNYDKQLTQS